MTDGGLARDRAAPTLDASRMDRVSLHATLKRRCDQNPDADAIVGDGVRISFGAFVDRVERMMALLARCGSPDEVTGVSIRDEPLHLVCAMALLCLRTPHVALPSHEPGAVKAAVVEALGVTRILCERPEDWMSEKAVVVPVGGALGAAPSDARARDAAPDDAALFVKTSGSTTTPKLFALSFKRLLRGAELAAEDIDHRRVMRASSVEFDSTRVYRLFSLLGGRTSILPPDDMTDLGAYCGRMDASQVHIGTYALSSLMRRVGGLVTRMPASTGLMTGGARVSGSLRKEIAETLSNRLFVSYATSEIGQISIASPDQHERFPEGVGFPRPDVEVEIVDASGAPAPRGEVGEIRARRPATPGGYVGDGEASQFRDGWFYPNDLVSWPEDGPLIFHGRADDVMLLNGVKILPLAIEDTLIGHPDVREAVAYAIASRTHGEIPAAAVVIADGASRAPERLLAYARAALGVRAPRRIVVVDEIPRTPTGKPMRRELAGL